MNGLKIAVIGAGSTYTPELIEGLIARSSSLEMHELQLMDIDSEKLQIVGGLAQRMLKKAGCCDAILTDNLDNALDGADFVLAQVRVGRLPARILDEKIPLKYNLIGQETTGIGGFFNALRTIPVMMDIASRMSELCPDAWLINFSNPSGIIAEALLNHTKVKMMGLCNIPVNLRRQAQKAFSERDMRLTTLGLNHLSYLVSVKDKETGEELLQRTLAFKETDSETCTFSEESQKEARLLERQLNINLKDAQKELASEWDIGLLQTLKAIPSSYLRYFYSKNARLESLKTEEKSRGEVCVEIERELLNMYRDVNLSEKPQILAKRGGAMYSEAAISLIDAIHNDKREMHVVNIKNNGALGFLDKNDAVEAAAVIGKNGAEPVKIEDFEDKHIISIIRSVKCYEKLTVEAALNGDDRAALQALMSNPLIMDYDAAIACYKEMKEAHAAYLTNFKHTHA